MSQPTAEQRLATLLSNLEVEAKNIDPAVPHHRLFMQVRALAEIVKDLRKTVWIYERGERLKVFATDDDARAWFEKHDDEGVAFQHEVLTADDVKAS